MFRPRVFFAAALAAAALAVGLFVAAYVWPSHRPAFRAWTTGTSVYVSTPASSRAYVEYGPTDAYGLFTAVTARGRLHRFDLANLDPNLRYHVRAVVRSEGRTQLGADLTM